MPPSATSVLVADGHPVYREGLRRWIGGAFGFDVVGDATDGPGAIVALREYRPDVAVVDQALPGIDAPRLTAIARRERLPTRMVILAETFDGRAAFLALSAGAAGFFAKDIALAELLAGLVAVAAGRVVLPPAV